MIQLGRHKFNVNTRRSISPLSSATPARTFTSPAPNALTQSRTRPTWPAAGLGSGGSFRKRRGVPRRIPRAGCFGKWSRRDGIRSEPLTSAATTLEEFLSLSEDRRLAVVQEFMAAHYQDGYTKGLHDLDGAPDPRRAGRNVSRLEVRAVSSRRPGLRPGVLDPLLSGRSSRALDCQAEGLRRAQTGFSLGIGPDRTTSSRSRVCCAVSWSPAAVSRRPSQRTGEYLFHELSGGGTFTFTRGSPGHHVPAAPHYWMRVHLCGRLSRTGRASFQRTRVGARLGEGISIPGGAGGGWTRHRRPVVVAPGRAAAILLCDEALPRSVVHAEYRQVLDPCGARMRGSGNRYTFDYLDFTGRLRRFETEAVPRFEAYHRLKGQLLDHERRRLGSTSSSRASCRPSFETSSPTASICRWWATTLRKQIGAAAAAKPAPT